MTKRLVNPTVKYISILTDETMPANGKPVIIKGAKYEEICKAVVKSIDEIEGDIHWRAMISGEKDTDDETYTKEDVKNAQRKFMKSLVSTEAVSDVNHNMEVQKGVYMVESYLTDEGSEIAWDGVSNVKENAALFAKAKEGKITGVSIYGWVEDVEEVKSKSENMLTAIYNKLFGKEEKTINKEELEMTKEEFKALKDEELKEYGFMRIPETTEAPATETQAEPDKEKEELKSANAKLTADLEALKTEMKDIIKKRTSDSTENSGLKPEKKPVSKAQWEKLDSFDKHNFSIEFPEIAKQYEN